MQYFPDRCNQLRRQCLLGGAQQALIGLSYRVPTSNLITADGHVRDTNLKDGQACQAVNLTH